jgi:hypothetical protein
MAGPDLEESVQASTEFSYVASNYKNPVCVFAPDNAQGVGFAVQTFTQTDAQFAVRGGDHMSIAGSNSIDT